MNTHLLHLLSVLFFISVLSGIHAQITQNTPPKEFLKQIRQPLSKNVWTEITGKIVHKKQGESSLSGDLRLRITFAPTSLHAQIVLNRVNVYGFEQTHNDATSDPKPSSKLDMPEKEQSPGLFQFGLTPGDLTFSFLYWDFLEELPEQSSRFQACRILKLADPNSDGYAIVWFNKEYGFPMEASWYKKDAKSPWRTLLMKGAKRFKSGMWFVKEMRLEGKDWKTKVQFDFAELNKENP
ncbi:MAG: hypothetical protein WCS73_07670 [Lentisphaeria bacterium]